ncbi:MAG: serine aminopeptidase domain-containing protein, partial [Ardenticatenaceae bacterium]
SMGGLIATRYALRHQEQLDALVLSGVALQVGDDVSPLLKRVGGLIAQVVPMLPVRPPAKNVLSRDPRVEERFRADPLCYQGYMKARMGHELMKAAEDASARLEQLSLPVLIMHGTVDGLTNPEGSKRLYERARSEDKTLKLWQDNYHEIFNDLDQKDVIAFMLDWLDERLTEGVGEGYGSGIER